MDFHNDKVFRILLRSVYGLPFLVPTPQVNVTDGWTPDGAEVHNLGQVAIPTYIATSSIYNKLIIR